MERLGMDRQDFFASLRKSKAVFGTSLSAAQVSGTEALLDACAANDIADAHHVANILAQCYHETAGAMQPIKETVMRHHKDKNPSDATVIARLDRAFARGQLPWVKAPYWRDGWFGRGFIQLTHKRNYDRFGIGKDDALDLGVAARVAVVGMRDGMFTGRRLADYSFPDALTLPPAQNPRRIVNGTDGTDATIAGHHRAFYAAIEAGGGWAIRPTEPVTETPKREHENGLAALLARLLAWIGGRA